MKTNEHFIYLIMLMFCFTAFTFEWYNNLELKRKADNLQIKVDILRDANFGKTKEIYQLNQIILNIAKPPPIETTNSYKNAKTHRKLY